MLLLGGPREGTGRHGASLAAEERQGVSAIFLRERCLLQSASKFHRASLAALGSAQVRA